jgi:hypothetical protein
LTLGERESGAARLEEAVAAYRAALEEQTRAPLQRVLPRVSFIHVNGRHYRSSRLAWLYMTGSWPVEIDHANLNRADDRWTNLREATRPQNNWNTRTPLTNTSGYKGVSRKRDKWRARIKVNGREISLGHFDTPERAFIAYIFASWDHHGEYGRRR